MDGQFKDQLKEVFENLNHFIEEQNKAVREEGGPIIGKQIIRIVGQMALLLTDLPFGVASSMDLDVVSHLDYPVFKKLSELLAEQGLKLERDSHLIWMPPNTEYETLLQFPYVEVQKAKPEFVVASKFKFKRPKDEKLITTYLRHFPDKKKEIKKLAEK